MWVNYQFLFCLIAASVVAGEVEYCDVNKCKTPACQCSGVNPSGIAKIPQLVALSIDDSPSQLVSQSFYETELYTRKNPDNCPISGTFFVPHEYTDYRVVNQLYNKGFEIGSHSITKNYSTIYWKDATSDLIVSELGGQRSIISKFANIPKNEIIGARIPLLQLNADETYKGLQDAGFAYDNSWPTYSEQSLFPYTLDYHTIQSCLVGKCPTQAHKGFWVLPIINWVDMNKAQCNKLLACNPQGTATEIFNWMKTNFERNYNHSRAPVSLLINYAWFTFSENSYEALQKFFDYLKSLKDVYVVSNKQVLEWMKKPVAQGTFSSCQPKRNPSSCSAVNCKLENNEGDIRYMGSCINCPRKYPWLGNVDGN